MSGSCLTANDEEVQALTEPGLNPKSALRLDRFSKQ
jgi:hypothetical protein